MRRFIDLVEQFFPDGISIEICDIDETDTCFAETESQLMPDIIDEGVSQAEKFIERVKAEIPNEVMIWLGTEGDDEVTIERFRVETWNRGYGYAGEAMATIAKLADRMSITIYLEALPDAEDEDMDQDVERLVNFYRRYGFEGDRIVDGGMLMCREPKSKTKTLTENHTGPVEKPGPEMILEKARRAGFYGFGGLCGEAAVVINQEAFEGHGRLVGAFNEAFLNAGQHIGHVAVLFGGKYWDSDGVPKELIDIESWGMLDADDPDYREQAEKLGIAWSDEAASEVTLVEFDNEDEVLGIFGRGNLPNMFEKFE